MDGLTVKGAQRLLDTGRTTSELNSIKVKPNPSSEKSESFSEVLSRSFNDVNLAQKEADSKTQDFVTGKSKDIAGVMIASEKADLALRLMTQVRNKILDAYQEIMKMQV